MVCCGFELSERDLFLWFFSRYVRCRKNSGCHWQEIWAVRVFTVSVCQTVSKFVTRYQKLIKSGPKSMIMSICTRQCFGIWRYSTYHTTGGYDSLCSNTISTATHSFSCLCSFFIQLQLSSCLRCLPVSADFVALEWTSKMAEHCYQSLKTQQNELQPLILECKL